MDEKLLELICCPETHQPLKLVDADLVSELNQRIEAGVLVNRSGGKLEQKIDEGLIREDGKVLYPVRQNIPTLLIEQGVLLDQ
ncbi:MAG: Trm112 family protein [Verrucomicrobiota bacterium]|jgi:uncharacterized protein YbaR (Trm112 family)|nr:Trm112 family protein [Verrucomicrobiota bacterium]